MERLNSALYTVSQGEVVTVMVQAVKVANLDSYTVDSVVQPPVSNDPRTYAFTVSKPSGMNHRTAVSFFFPDEAPDDAEYRVFVSGDQGGGVFDGPAVSKEDDIEDISITFRVN
jgi:hypothetical protein